MKGCRGEDDGMGAVLVILGQGKATDHETGQGRGKVGESLVKNEASLRV
jgi:hypothetical protein